MTMETMEILANENIRLEQENQMLRESEAQLALDVSALAVKNGKLREALLEAADDIEADHRVDAEKYIARKYRAIAGGGG